jgi:AraC-like DNA-binding protein
MKLFVKYMVSIRCKLFVKSELEKLGLNARSIELGQVDLPEDISERQKFALDTALRKAGLELMDDKKSILIEKIKNVVVEVVHYREDPLNINFSDFLSQQLNHEYNYLSNLFSEVQGTTIEHFIIMHKIERVKELLLYDELTLTEIAFKLNYSSVSHLSNQFKKVTGLTPSFFRLMKNKKRTALEDI